MQRENARAFRGVSVHRRHGRVLPNLVLVRDLAERNARFLKSNLPEMDLSALGTEREYIATYIATSQRDPRRKRREYIGIGE